MPKVSSSRSQLALCFILTLCGIPLARTAEVPELPRQGQPRNIVFILTDDHRADALGYKGHPFLETPRLDELARGGVDFSNAVVTTSLCSPSRGSILTGLYAHNHRVIDNNNPVSEELVFFPQYLQAAGYETAFVGKWHMGGDDDSPQRGFDHWVSFRGQGTYWADGRGVTRRVAQTHSDGFNVNGTRVPQRGYITDELTDYALDWLQHRDADKPFMLYVSHKAVHSDFVAADRHLGTYRDADIPLPDSAAPATAKQDKPRWVRDQRNSRHGIDFGYNVEDYTVAKYARRYYETLLSVDDSVGRIMDYLKAEGLLESTLVVYMGDNGFHFGEHGLIDKRTAYEDSIKVPLIFHCPDLFPQGSTVSEIVANIDIAATLIEIAGLTPPLEKMDGRSFFPLAQGESIPWRNEVLYEYFWEWNGPYTPTMHALRGERYKYIRYYGVWDIDELYDLKNDPEEKFNLINEPAHQGQVTAMNKRLFEVLEDTGGLTLTLQPNRGSTFPLRRTDRSTAAEFPPTFMHEPESSAP